MKRGIGWLDYTGWVLAAVFVVVLAFTSGGRHDGKVLVPAKSGAPEDLPRWACEEIVNLRVQKIQLFEEYVKLAEGGRPVTFLHFRTGYTAACR